MIVHDSICLFKQQEGLFDQKCKTCLKQWECKEDFKRVNQ